MDKNKKYSFLVSKSVKNYHNFQMFHRTAIKLFLNNEFQKRVKSFEFVLNTYLGNK